MPGLSRGLYEALITDALETQLREVGERLVARRRPLHQAEAADRIALHLSQVVQRSLALLKDENRVEEGIALARKIIDVIDESLSAEMGGARPTTTGDLLDAIAGRQPDGTPEAILSPLTPLLDTTLLTNAPHEPRLHKQILTEIDSADAIDLVMAFIRRSGIVPLMDALKRHCAAGRRLRVLTTIYTGSTEERALDLLSEAGAEVRVSYDVSSTRLHAKAWLFHRQSGFSTAYIGSSNLTYSAQVSGLEWNVRVSGARNPNVIRQMDGVFEAYLNSGDFRLYDREEFRGLAKVTDTGPDLMLSPIEIRLEPFQERLLEQIAHSREIGYHRNLLAAATGTGKTVMAAVDYARLKDVLWILPRFCRQFISYATFFSNSTGERLPKLECSRLRL